MKYILPLGSVYFPIMLKRTRNGTPFFKTIEPEVAKSECIFRRSDVVKGRNSNYTAYCNAFATGMRPEEVLQQFSIFELPRNDRQIVAIVVLKTIIEQEI